MISILFLAADPTNASRLHLDEELREIQEKLQLAKLRDQFTLHQRMSVRSSDVSQALLDINPQIVHFSGHGTNTGALCFVDRTGEAHSVQPEALASLFEQFEEQLECVILNACYSVTQAEAIAVHIPYVIGMDQEVDDKSAITFSIGFYQALGSGRSIGEAYKLGCVQMRLEGILEYRTPVLINKRQSTFGRSHVRQQYRQESDDRPDKAVDFPLVRSDSVVSLPLSQFRKHVAVIGNTGSGKTNTLNWLAATLWGQNGVPFFAINHWQGVSPSLRETVDGVTYHRIEVANASSEVASVLDTENKVASRLDEVFGNITIERLSSAPTILDIKLTKWNLSRVAFRLTWSRLVKNLMSYHQSESLRLVVIVDELDDIFDEIDLREFCGNLRDLRRCGIGVSFTSMSIDERVLREVRNYLIFPRSTVWIYGPPDVIDAVKHLSDFRFSQTQGEAILLLQGVASPNIVSIPMINS